MMSRQRTTVPSCRSGFGLAETVVAMLVGTVAVLALGSVLASTSQLQSLSTSRLEMLALSESKMEDMRRVAALHTANALNLAPGGSVTADVTNYNDVVTSGRNRSYKRRWLVTAALNGTRTVVVRVAPTNKSKLEIPWVDVTSLIVVE